MCLKAAGNSPAASKLSSQDGQLLFGSRERLPKGTIKHLIVP